MSTTKTKIVSRGPINRATEHDPHGLTANDPGAKFDADKVRPSLIINAMPLALLAVSEVGTYGANKYSENGWKDVDNGIARYTDAMDRHRIKEGLEVFDEDSNLRHAAQVAWNALARLELMLCEFRSIP